MEITLTLTPKESETFFNVLDCEHRIITNEYDPDTCHVPSKKRVKDGQHAWPLIMKWSKTQPQLHLTHDMMRYPNSDNVRACSLVLTDDERKYVTSLLQKTVRDCHKELSHYPEPYTGALQSLNDVAVISEQILCNIRTQEGALNG